MENIRQARRRRRREVDLNSLVMMVVMKNGLDGYDEEWIGLLLVKCFGQRWESKTSLRL
jgi:hypothetical protein